MISHLALNIININHSYPKFLSLLFFDGILESLGSLHFIIGIAKQRIVYSFFLEEIKVFERAQAVVSSLIRV